MSSRTVILPTSLLVVLATVWLALANPSVGHTQAPTGRIYGQLVAGSDPAPDQTLVLRRYFEVQDIAVLTTTTTISGTYEFVDPPTPPFGWTYYVQFGPNETNPAYVHTWYGPDIVDYQVGDERSGGVLDIADVTLVTPAAEAVVRLPMTFRWTARGRSSDIYEVHLVDLTTRADIVLGPVSASDSTTLTEAEALTHGIQYGRGYGWYVWITDRDEPSSFGSSYDILTLSFTRYQVFLPQIGRNPSR